MNCRHDGKRKPRGHCGKKPLLGHYLIITDAEKTEKQYFEGIRDSFSSELRRRIVIKVERALTKDLLDYALYSRAENPNVNSTWLVLDRDEVPGFDSLIENAEKNGIEVGWSNPCFETWLHAYFGRMPNFSDAKKAIDEFKREFQKKTGVSYEKNDPRLYSRLTEHGSEQRAIKIAKSKAHNDQNSFPSERIGYSTVYKLVEEIALIKAS